MSQITIILKPAEKEVLLDLADREQRDPRSLGGLLVREALENRGLLEPASMDKKPVIKGVSDGRSN